MSNGGAVGASSISAPGSMPGSHTRRANALGMGRTMEGAICGVGVGDDDDDDDGRHGEPLVVGR